MQGIRMTKMEGSLTNMLFILAGTITIFYMIFYRAVGNKYDEIIQQISNIPRVLGKLWEWILVGERETKGYSNAGFLPWLAKERSWNYEYENIVGITFASNFCRLYVFQFQHRLARASFILRWQQGAGWPKSPALSGWRKSPANQCPIRKGGPKLYPLYLPCLVNWFWRKEGEKIKRKATN